MVHSFLFRKWHLPTIWSLIRKMQLHVSWIRIQILSLWQQVGAGKTFEMVASRYGNEAFRITKQDFLYVVPNHIVSQWANDFMRLYPNANVLVATKKDMSKRRRMAFTTKIATGNYDAIIMAHSGFKMISIGTDLQIELMRKQMDEMNPPSNNWITHIMKTKQRL